MKNVTLAIIGRPNVGKSTIFNRLAGERISIVENIPGVTRDRVYAQGDWLGRTLNLIDTGGIEFSSEDFGEQIRIQASLAMEQADVIIMMTDVRDGVTEMDERIAHLLHKMEKPILLAVNKVDNPEQRSDIYDFYRLGLGDPYPISGAHGIGLGDLLEKVYELTPLEIAQEEAEEVISFAFIGRPNVGKSSLVNAILGEKRVIVSNVPGTTRDAVDTYFTREGQQFRVIDTAGMRKRGKVQETTEKYSVLRAIGAIERADVVLMVLNAEEGIQDQDKNIAGYAHEAGKAMLIVVNKWDTIVKDNHTMKKFEDDIRKQFQFLSYAPILFVSAETGQRLNQLTDEIEKVYHNTRQRIQSSVLNQVLNEAIRINPAPTDKGRKLRVYYLTQVSVAPPTFVVMVNDKALMHFTYERFLINQIRRAFNFEGTPIRLIVRERS